MSSIIQYNTSVFFHRVEMWRFLTGVRPPPQKKAKLSDTCRCMVRERKEKTRTTADMERQATLVAVHTKWHDDLQLLC